MSGADLKASRQAQSWSQRELAQRAEIHHSAVQYWERQETLDPSAHAVRRMAEALGWRIADQYARTRHGVLSAEEEIEAMVEVLLGLPKNLAKRLMNYRVRCGAKTRKGTPCRAQSEPGRRRCKLHGGLSTGPKTVEGRRRIAEAQRRRWTARKSGPFAL